MTSQIFLDTDAKNEAQRVICLQNWLCELNSKNLEKTCESVLKSVFVESKERIQQLFWNITQAITIRTMSIDCLCSLITYLDSYSEKIESLVFLRPILIRTLLLPKPMIDLFLSNVGDFILLRYCVYRMNISITEIIEQIRMFCAQHPDHKHYHCLLFCVFAPEIEKASDEFYHSLLDLIIEECSCKTFLKDFLSSLPDLKANNWDLFNECMRIGGYPKEINVSLKTDDLEGFRELSIHPMFDFNKRIRPSTFEPCHFMQNEPTLIQYSAFHASLRCFKYLLLHGADLSLIDGNNTTLPQCVVAGGSTELLRFLEQRSCDMSGCLHFASRFRRYEIFNWLFSDTSSLSGMHMKLGSVLHNSAAHNCIRSILFCIDKQVDVNLQTTDQQTSLHYAVKNRMSDAVRVLLACDTTNVNIKDADGLTPLHHAALFDDSTMVVELLRSPKVDVNQKNNWVAYAFLELFYYFHDASSSSCSGW